MRKSAKFLALLLSVLMFVSAFAFGTSAAFTDVPANDTALTNAVSLLANLGITKGTTETTFGTSELVTRQQMAAFIFRLMMKGKSVEGGENNSPFTDLDDPTFYSMITWANDQGVIKGTSATTFNPKGNITLQDAYVMLVRALGYEKEESFVYPHGYIDKAEKIDLDEDLPASVNYSTKLTRGNVAILLHNAFYADMATYEIGYRSLGYEIVGYKADGTALINSLGEEPYKEYDTIAEKIYDVKKTVQRIVATTNYKLDDYDLTRDDGGDFVTFDVIPTNKDHKDDEPLGSVAFEDLGLTGKPDDYFLADCMVYVKDDDVLAADSLLVKKTSVKGTFDLTTGSADKDFWPSSASNVSDRGKEKRYRVFTGTMAVDSLTAAFFDVPWKFAKDVNYDERDSVHTKLVFLGADDEADPDDEDYTPAFNFESDRDPFGRGSEFYDSSDFTRLKVDAKSSSDTYIPGLYSNWGIYTAIGRGHADGVGYEMDVWDSNGDGLIDYLWYKPYTIGRLDTTEGEYTKDLHGDELKNYYSCIMEDDGYPTIYTDGAYIEGPKPVDKKFATAYVNGPANYIKIGEVIDADPIQRTVTKRVSDQSPVYFDQGGTIHRWGGNMRYIGLMSAVGSIYPISNYMLTGYRYTGESNFTSGSLTFELGDSAECILYNGCIVYASGKSKANIGSTDYVMIVPNEGSDYAYSIATANSVNGILDDKNNYLNIYKDGEEVSVKVKVIKNDITAEANGIDYVKTYATPKASSKKGELRYDFSDYVGKLLKYTTDADGLYTFEVAPIKCFNDIDVLSDDDDDTLYYAFNGYDGGVTSAGFIKSSGNYYKFVKKNSNEIKDSVAPCELLNFTKDTKVVIKSVDSDGEATWTEYTYDKKPNFGNDILFTNIIYVVRNNPNSTKIEDLVYLYAEYEDELSESGNSKVLDLRIIKDSYINSDGDDGDKTVCYDVFDPFTGEEELGYKSYNNDTSDIAEIGGLVLLTNKQVADHIDSGSLNTTGDMCTSDVTMSKVRAGDVKFGYGIVDDFDPDSGYLYVEGCATEFVVDDDTIVTFLDLTGKEPKFSKKSSSILSSTSKTYRNGTEETLKVFVSSAEVKKEDYERAVAIIVVKDEPTK